MSKQRLLIGIAAVLSLATASAMAAPVSTALIAGQHTNIGNVTVNNDATNLYVIYNLTGGWTMSDSHVAVACTLAGIPQSKGSNPPVGQFPFKATHNPVVTTFTYTIPLSLLPGCNAKNSQIYIAAHADTQAGCGASTMTVRSGVDTTMVTRRRLGTGSMMNEPGTLDASMYGPSAAVSAWEPCLTYPNCPDASSAAPSPDPTPRPSLWDQQTSNVFFNAGADWIWATHYCDECVKGEEVRFETAFNIPGAPISSSLDITCDNGYEAKVNGTSLGSNGVAWQGTTDWRDSDFRQLFVNTSGWQNVNHFTTLPVEMGANHLVVDAANEYMDWDEGQPTGNQQINPGACAWILDVTFDGGQCGGVQTSWAQGAAFSGANWAMYFKYQVQ